MTCDFKIMHGWRWAGCLAILWLLAGTTSGLAQAPYEEPQWLKFRLTGAYLDLTAEGEEQTINSSRGGEATNRRLYFAPSVGLAAAGSIYHPDLLAFSLEAEPGYTWQQFSSSPGTTRSEDSVLQTYHVSGRLFELKPFRTTIFATRSHSFNQYDFFSAAVSDVESHGLQTGYPIGPVPVTLSFQEMQRDLSAFLQHTTDNQRNLELHARNDRSAGSYTDLTYRYGEFDNTTTYSLGSFGYGTANHFVTLSDVEHLGRNREIGLNSRLNFNEVDSARGFSRSLNTGSGLTVQHTPHFGSDYSYAFSWFNDGFSDLQQHFGRAGVHHQLYESLSSGADVHGSVYRQAGADGSGLDSQSGGVGGSLGYSKRLGTWGRLFVGDGASYDLLSQSSSGGGVLIANEPHALAAGQPAALNQPRVLSIVSVTDTNNVPLQEGLDYSVNRSVDPWTIEIISTSLVIRSGDTVLVTYKVQANPSGSYATLANQFSVRLDLFNGFIGFYSSLSRVEYFTNSPGFVLDNVAEFQAGADLNWHELRCDANYTDHTSSLVSYQSRSLTEAYSRRLSTDSMLSVNFSQSWNDYPDQDQHTAFYSFITRLDWRPVGRLTFGAEGGLTRQRGSRLDQDLATARAHMDWSMGKLSCGVGYAYDTQNFSGDFRQRHSLTLHVRRNF